jgi:Ca2+-binding RTX toxin-like protein
MAYDIVFGPGGQFSQIGLEDNKKTLLAGYAIAGIDGGTDVLLTIATTGSVYRVGGYGAIFFYGGSVTNYGSVYGNAASGIGLANSGTVTNYGTIVGEDAGVNIGTLGRGTFFINNSGVMVGSYGVVSSIGSGVTTIVNTVGGTILGTLGFGVYNTGGGTLNLTNAGAIVGDVTSIRPAHDTVVNDGTIQGNVNLGAGNDVFSGVGRVTGTVYGDIGYDNLTGGIYDDRLDGGADPDILDGGLGNDTMIGGAGNDSFFVDSVGDKVIEAVGGGNDTVYARASYALRSGQEIETLRVDYFNADYDGLAINLTGNEFTNTLIGNAAANKLDGRGGADTMTGGDGSDIYYVDDVGDAVVETANHGTDAVYATVSHTLSANVEILRALGSTDISLTGNDLANTITGNAGNNRLDGAAGADKMTGGAGDDTYVVDNVLDTAVEKAGGGVDTVESSISYTLRGHVENLLLTGTAAIDGTGNAAANTIVGNGAANTIDGKGGLDTLTGGGGADTFVFSSKLNAAANLASITDFEHGIDRIALDDRFFKFMGMVGPLGDQFFTISAPTTRDQHVVYDQATGVLSYDIDGAGAKAAVAFAQVAPGTVLDHNDFLIV